MRTIFVEPVTFECHLTDDGTMIQVETDRFDGKCDEYIEGHRLVPDGKTWIREDGEVFTGIMFSPWKPDAELRAAQKQFEIMQEELSIAYREGVNSV